MTTDRTTAWRKIPIGRQLCLTCLRAGRLMPACWHRNHLGLPDYACQSCKTGGAR